MGLLLEFGGEVRESVRSGSAPVLRITLRKLEYIRKASLNTFVSIREAVARLVSAKVLV